MTDWRLSSPRKEETVRRKTTFFFSEMKAHMADVVRLRAASVRNHFLATLTM